MAGSLAAGLATGVAGASVAGGGVASATVNVNVPRSMWPSSVAAVQRTSNVPFGRDDIEARRACGSAGSTDPLVTVIPLPSTSATDEVGRSASSNVMTIDGGSVVSTESAAGTELSSDA